jgi:hypothetical protein
MFEEKAVDATQVEEAAVVAAVQEFVDPDDYGIFNGAKITVENGVVTVLIPLTNGTNVTTVSERKAACWLVDNVAGPLLAEAEKHKV